MDALINSLPTHSTGNKGKFYVIDDTASLSDQNMCTVLQVNAANSK